MIVKRISFHCLCQMSMKIATVEEAAVVAQIVGNEVKGVSVLREKGHLKDSAGVIEEMNL